ncbi:hypothetical protein O3P69_001878 [Scylla paramamosain]|uniref:Uncharacterized protein n=1 Tax=Scylla paramamosain TaxID=85552 RepID=A0AAW0V034_SCYPA
MQYGTTRYGESTVALRPLGPGPGAAYPMFSLYVAILIVTKGSRKSHHIFHLVYNQLECQLTAALMDGYRTCPTVPLTCDAPAVLVPTPDLASTLTATAASLGTPA